MLNDEFYNSIAENYNEMIPLEKQIESKTNFFKHFINENTNTAADLGAGSGADSIALAKLGLNVTAFEPSTEMVKQAKTNFAEHNVDVEIHNKKITGIDESFRNSYDLIVSLGNTFGNIDKGEIGQSIAKRYTFLREGGKVVIQLLNYYKILKEKERIINITASDQKQFVRFYDFINNRILFNVLSFDRNDFSNRKLITTEIFPYRKVFLESLFNKHYPHEINVYGDLNRSPFDQTASPNLIMEVIK